jgi:glycolate oxidase FAD binding subunit
MSSPEQFAARLESLLGAEHVQRSDEALVACAVNGVFPGALVRPSSAEEVVQLVRFAADEKLELIAHGSRSKSDIGMPPARYDIAVDMSRLHEIDHYDANDLTLSVDTGMPLRELAAHLAEHGQFLPLAVPCFETSTVGGAVASGIDSALRQQYGTARDFLIGAEFVDGKGNLCKSGGRVVKNVTGYDLHKLLIGSLGTLGIITRLNFRTFTLPEVSAGHLAIFKNIEEALRYHVAIENAGLPLANVELFSPEVAEILAAILRREDATFPEALAAGGWFVYAAFEGNPAVIHRISRDLERLASESNAKSADILSNEENDSVGGMLREAFEWLRWASAAVVVYRLSILTWNSNQLRELLRLAANKSLRCGILLRAAGILYFAVFAEQENTVAQAALGALSAQVLMFVADAQGHATVLHAPISLKSQINVWGETREAFPLMLKIKKAFDPNTVFARGRFVGGI